MFRYMNNFMLPANTTTRDEIKTEAKVTRPIALIVKRPPRLFENRVSTPAPRTEEPKEMSAKDFPILKGFA